MFPFRFSKYRLLFRLFKANIAWVVTVVMAKTQIIPQVLLEEGTKCKKGTECLSSTVDVYNPHVCYKKCYNITQYAAFF